MTKLHRRAYKSHLLLAAADRQRKLIAPFLPPKLFNPFVRITIIRVYIFVK